jgi:hypothetical protein
MAAAFNESEGSNIDYHDESRRLSLPTRATELSRRVAGSTID